MSTTSETQQSTQPTIETPSAPITNANEEANNGTMDTKNDEEKSPFAQAPSVKCPNTGTVLSANHFTRCTFVTNINSILQWTVFLNMLWYIIVIIFDWDDTLLASTYLASKGYRLDTDTVPPDGEEVDRQLKELQTSVISLLELALKYGHVHIVTNAETGWVQLSAQKFMPGLVPMLSKVPVLSARSTFEPMHPDAPLKWKFYAFQEKIASCFPADGVTVGGAQKNIVSFGDSHVEREAVRAVTRGMAWTRTKSVKFAERPSVEQLRRQVELVSNCFHYIHTHDGDLDLQLTVTVNATSPNGDAPEGDESANSEQSNTPMGTDHMPAGTGSGLPVDELPTPDLTVAPTSA